MQIQGMFCATRLQHVATDEVKQGIIYTEASLLAMDFAALDLSTFVHSAALMLSTLVAIGIVHVLYTLFTLCLPDVAVPQGFAMVGPTFSAFASARTDARGLNLNTIQLVDN